MPPARPLAAVDLLLAIAHAAFALAWTRALGFAPWVPALVAAHAAGAALPLLLRRGQVTHPAARGLADASPLLFMLAFWSGLGLYFSARGGASHDLLVAGWDRALTGGAPHRTWAARQPEPWVALPLYASYALYFPVLFLPPLLAARRHGAAGFGGYWFGVLGTYLPCYMLDTLFPVIGPANFGVVAAPPAAASGLASLYGAGKALFDSLGTAFPSTHTAGSIASAVMAWRWLGGWWGGLLGIQAAGVALGSVYTGNHYAVDVLAGVAAAAATQLAVPALERGCTRLARRLDRAASR